MPVYFVLTGPTAAGKTGRLLSFAQSLSQKPVFVISADSRQVYRYMDIGTGKPEPSELEMLPHYGIDCLEPGINYSVYQYLIQAAKGLQAAREHGAMAWVCGGTGLYIRAMTESLELGSPPRPQLRDAIQQKIKELSPRSVAERLNLELADPDNPVRVVRQVELTCTDPETVRAAYTFAGLDPALAVTDCEHLGDEYRQAIEEIKGWECGGIYVLDPGKDVLLDRMRVRIRGMFETGLVEEVTGIREMGYGATEVVANGIGYREAGQVIDGGLSIEEAIDTTVIRTRQYAKRQRTYFNGRGWPVFDDDGFFRVLRSIQG